MKVTLLVLLFSVALCSSQSTAVEKSINADNQENNVTGHGLNGFRKIVRRSTRIPSNINVVVKKTNQNQVSNSQPGKRPVQPANVIINGGPNTGTKVIIRRKVVKRKTTTAEPTTTSRQLKRRRKTTTSARTTSKMTTTTKKLTSTKKTTTSEPTTKTTQKITTVGSKTTSTSSTTRTTSTSTTAIPATNSTNMTPKTTSSSTTTSTKQTTTPQADITTTMPATESITSSSTSAATASTERVNDGELPKMNVVTTTTKQPTASPLSDTSTTTAAYDYGLLYPLDNEDAFIDDNEYDFGNYVDATTTKLSTTIPTTTAEVTTRNPQEATPNSGVPVATTTPDGIGMVMTPIPKVTTDAMTADYKLDYGNMETNSKATPGSSMTEIDINGSPPHYIADYGLNFGNYNDMYGMLSDAPAVEVDKEKGSKSDSKGHSNKGWKDETFQEESSGHGLKKGHGKNKPRGNNGRGHGSQGGRDDAFPGVGNGSFPGNSGSKGASRGKNDDHGKGLPQ